MIKNNAEHVDYILKFFNVLNNRHEQPTTLRLALWIFDSFPEYRDLGIESIEREVVEIIYA